MYCIRIVLLLLVPCLGGEAAASSSPTATSCRKALEAWPVCTQLYRVQMHALTREHPRG
jgi:hypothetical protein